MTIDNKLLCNNFKISRLVKENCKTSSIWFFFVFLNSINQYIQVIFLLNFLITTLKNKFRAAIDIFIDHLSRSWLVKAGSQM